MQQGESTGEQFEHRQERRFENQELSSLQWEHTSTKDGVQTFRTETNVTPGEKDFTLIGVLRMVETPTSNMAHYIFSIKDKGEFIADGILNITDNFKDSEGLITADISRHDENERILPKGTGVALYEKMLDLLDRMLFAKPMRHREIAAPTDENIVKWESKFGPILSKHGYTKTSERSWEKLYPEAAKEQPIS